MMVHVRFLSPNGDLVREVDSATGVRLLDVAQANGLPLEGTCEGAMACSTCHVILTREDFALLPPPSAHEEDMLDFTPHVAPTSRLSCQVWLDGTLQAIEVTLPPGHSDMSHI